MAAAHDTASANHAARALRRVGRVAGLMGLGMVKVLVGLEHLGTLEAFWVHVQYAFEPRATALPGRRGRNKARE